MSKKIIALTLSIAVLFSAFAIPASAATEVTSPAERGFYRFVDKLLDSLVGGIAALIKDPGWEKKSDYVSENFYEGLTDDEFIDAPADNAAWSVGYSNASLLTGKELTEEHYVGGSLSVTKKLATEVRDDQKVRTVAISDGRGISIFASLDAYGLSNKDVRGIRAQFAQEAAKRGLDITSVNISALHQHSCVDTLGFNGDLVGALFVTPVRNILGIEAPNGQNKNYMENLYNVTVKSMLDAIDDMQTGSLYFGTVDVSEYIRDKRDPQVFDKNIYRLRFVPDAQGEEETWIVNGAIHCVGNGAGGTVLTGDYPYYMEKYINENAHANFFYIQGAELAITSQNGDTLDIDAQLLEEYGDRYATLAAFGKRLAELTCSIKDETPVAPILNIRFNEVFFPVNNSILKLAAKGGLLTNRIVKSGLGKYEVVTEIGYAEFGTQLAVAIIPGELAPEIAFGGATTADKSWDGKSWDYTPFCEAVGNRKLLVFGITNDQVGYMLTDNNWHSYLTENEEIVSTGPKAGSTAAEAWLALYNEVR